MIETVDRNCETKKVEYNIGEQEWWCVWYVCPECYEPSLTYGFKFCPHCGVPVVIPDDTKYIENSWSVDKIRAFIDGEEVE